MRITIQTGDGSSPSVVILGDDLKRETITGWLPSRRAKVERVALLRADWAPTFDRKNMETSFGWRTERVHADYPAAVKFVRDHLLNLPRQGLIEVSQSGSSAFSFFFADAMLAEVNLVELSGVTTVWEYKVEAGEPLAVAP